MPWHSSVSKEKERVRAVAIRTKQKYHVKVANTADKSNGRQQQKSPDTYILTFINGERWASWMKCRCVSRVRLLSLSLSISRALRSLPCPQVFPSMMLLMTRLCKYFATPPWAWISPPKHSMRGSCDAGIFFPSLLLTAFALAVIFCM